MAHDRYREGPLSRRLAACLRALHVESVCDARARLMREPALLPTALGAVLIGITSFFRDPPVFDSLRNDVLPELCGQGQPVSVWSAGCSDGAELYSVAMLLAELGGLRDADLLGTDCRSLAIHAARRGEYDFPSVRSIEPHRRERYFEQAFGGRLRVSSELRRACRWKIADAFAHTHRTPLDLVLCRNLAIYLEPHASAELWRKLAGALRPGGYLVVGKAERPCRGLPLDRVGACVYRRGEDC